MTDSLFPKTENAILKAAIALVATARSHSHIRAKSDPQPWKSTKQMMQRYKLTKEDFKIRGMNTLLADGSMVSVGGMTLEHRAVKRDGKERFRHFWREAGGAPSAGTASEFISEACKMALQMDGGMP